MKIVIVGGGFANKGAEAMLLTLRSALVRRLGEVELLLWLPRENEIALAWANGFTPVPLYPDGRRGPKRLKGDLRERLAGFPRPGNLLKGSFEISARRALRARAEEIDGVVDISGFAYGDTWGERSFARVAPLLDHCRSRGKPVVFLPQAWGGFKRSRLRADLRTHLLAPRTRYYTRDAVSGGHLEEALGLAGGSLLPRADIVFAYQGGSEALGHFLLAELGVSGKRPVVGISPNMRVYARTKHARGENPYLAALAGIARHAIERHDADVVFQANEISDAPNRGPDDRFLTSRLAALVDRPGRCFAGRRLLSAEESKSLVGAFDFLVASRFHSLVFALSQGVPGMALSWSHKYKELLSLFGLGDEVVEYERLDGESLRQHFDAAIAAAPGRRPLIREKAAALAVEVEGLFDEVAAHLAP